MRRWLGILLAVLVLLAVGGGAYWFFSTRIIIDDAVYLRDMEELDLSGKPVEDLEKLGQLSGLRVLNLRDTGLIPEEYDLLRQMLPGCRILWSVPFQNELFGESIEKLSVNSLSREDIQTLGYFTNLKKLDARGCRDYDVLMELKAQRPGLEIVYDVTISGKTFPYDVPEIELKDPDLAQLEWVLPLLPNLERVTLTGRLPDNERIYELKQGFPDVTFAWGFEVMGVATHSLAEELILSGIPMESVEPVEEALKYFYNLKRVEMCDCGLPSPELDALWKRHPDTRIVWNVQVGMCNLRTDSTVFMPYKFGYNGKLKLSDAHMKEIIYCVDIMCLDMGHMGIRDYSFLEYMPKMKYLVLADTPGTDFSALASLKELVFLELFMTGFDQAEVLTGLTKLEDLNLGHCQIKNVEPLKQMTWLKRLWMPGARRVWTEHKLALRAALPDTVINFIGKSSTGEGWRESPNYYAMRDLLNMGYMKT